MTTPKPKTRHVAMRLEPALIERVDALAPSLSTPWFKAKRSDVLRALIHEALPILEKNAPKPARKKGGAR